MAVSLSWYLQVGPEWKRDVDATELQPGLGNFAELIIDLAV